MEDDVFQASQVAKQLKQFEILAIDLTEDTPEVSDTYARWKLDGIPKVLIVTADKKVIKHLDFEQINSPEKFLSHLKPFQKTGMAE